MARDTYLARETYEDAEHVGLSSCEFLLGLPDIAVTNMHICRPFSRRRSPSGLRTERLSMVPSCTMRRTSASLSSKGRTLCSVPSWRHAATPRGPVPVRRGQESFSLTVVGRLTSMQIYYVLTNMRDPLLRTTHLPTWSDRASIDHLATMRR